MVLRSLVFLAAALAALPAVATAQQLSRYSLEVPAATPPARDPLSRMVTISAGPGTSILDATRQALAGTGYALATAPAASPAQHRVLSRPLPDTQWEMGPLPVRRALRALAGPAFLLIEDPVNRLVGFDLRSPYRPSWRFSPGNAPPLPAPPPPPDPATGFDLQLGRRHAPAGIQLTAHSWRAPPPTILALAPGRATLLLNSGDEWEAIPRDIINGWRVMAIDAEDGSIRFEAPDMSTHIIQAMTL